MEDERKDIVDVHNITRSLGLYTAQFSGIFMWARFVHISVDIKEHHLSKSVQHGKVIPAWDVALQCKVNVKGSTGV